MRGLRVEDVAVAGVPELFDFCVRVGHRQAVTVPVSRIRTVSDVLVGLNAPESGRVEIDGSPLADAHHRARSHGIRLVPSDGGLLPNLTVLRNILYTECVVERHPSGDREKQVRQGTAIEYGLNDVLDRYPYEITIGRRRMAGLARALRADPSVVVLEDGRATPTWGALLGGWALLSGVATVLVTFDPARAPGMPGGEDADG